MLQILYKNKVFWFKTVAYIHRHLTIQVKTTQKRQSYSYITKSASVFMQYHWKLNFLLKILRKFSEVILDELTMNL